MNHKFTLPVILLITSLCAQAQYPITLTYTDMPTAGYTATTAKDTPLTSVSYGSAGANQVYNFSTLTNSVTKSAQYAAPTGAQSSAFTNANLVVSANGVSIILDAGTTKFQAIGLQGYAYGSLVNTTLSPVEDIYHFPMQYQSTFYGNWGFYQGFTGGQVGQNVDSVREIFTDHFSSTVDGWGKVITPVGSYNALRVKRIDTTVTELDYKLFSFSGWTALGGYPITEITTEYSYVSKETKGAVVSFEYDSAGNLKDASYSLTPPSAPIAGFTFVNGATGLVTFTDTSLGYPNRYHWSFGDGDTSNITDPTHTYAANGTYYVCETVYNAGGNNTFCDSVKITNAASLHLPPVAVNDVATDFENKRDTINVTANDYSTTGDAFCIKNVYGSGLFTVLGCNDVIFNPTPNFLGYDTVYYIICNTVQTTLCDTARVIVDVVKLHLPPVAVNSTDTVLQPADNNIDVTVHDYSPSTDSFCITRVIGPGAPNFSVQNCNDLTFHPDSTFTGNDTVSYIICNFYQPTLCDTASVIVTVTPNPALLPVTNFTLYSISCEGTTAISQATKADSIIWNFIFNNHPTLDSNFSQVDTAHYLYASVNGSFEACLTAFNKFGSSSKCDTVEAVCGGIQEVQLSGIQMFPNPASTLLTIDMHRNTNEITKNYSAIEIYNAIGQKIITMSKNGQADVVNIPVNRLPGGIYLATIVDGKGTSSVLGKFTVIQ